ncbi:MAG: SEL1-like repeat protein, partial [Alphaproteobacteria bacterium]|nr:SEL1-like repeat protein [Alphaproteobacteria bacterium]
MYENGFGVPRDADKAAGWYRKAAAQGDPVALSKLGARSGVRTRAADRITLP